MHDLLAAAVALAVQAEVKFPADAAGVISQVYQQIYTLIPGGSENCSVCCICKPLEIPFTFNES